MTLVCFSAFSEDKELLRKEQPNIRKIQEFSRKEGAILVFTLPGSPLAYVNRGVLQWLEPGPRLSKFDTGFAPAPAPNTGLIAFGGSDSEKNHYIDIYDLEKRVERQHVRIPCLPLSLGWSSNSADIAVLCQEQVLLLSASTGTEKSSRPPPTLGQQFKEGHFWNGPLQILGDRGAVLVGLSYQVPVKGEPGTWSGRSAILRISEDGVTTPVVPGDYPSLSPGGDVVAYYTDDDKLATMSATGTQQRTLCKAPRSLFYRHELMPPIVWAPAADRVIFHTWSDWEKAIGGIYVVTLETRERVTLATGTTINIIAWY